MLFPALLFPSYCVCADWLSGAKVMDVIFCWEWRLAFRQESAWFSFFPYLDLCGQSSAGHFLDLKLGLWKTFSAEMCDAYSITAINKGHLYKLVLAILAQYNGQ